jgi:hypothetical protein
MADLTLSESTRRLSDYVTSEEFGKTYFASWTGANATTFVDLPIGVGVTAPQPSLQMILAGVTGPVADVANGVATVQLIANSISGQITLAIGKAAAASASANAAALSAVQAGTYSDVAGARADAARGYMEQTRDQANSVQIANATIASVANAVAVTNAVVLTLKTAAELAAAQASANAVIATGAVATTLSYRDQAAANATAAATSKTQAVANATAAAASATNAATSNTNANASKLAAANSATAAATANASVQAVLVSVNGTLTSVNTINAAVHADKLAADNAVVVAGIYAAQAAVYASQINPANYVTNASLTWANVAGKPTYFPTDTANVSGLAVALAEKVDTGSFTWTNLGSKPTTFTPSAHTHVIADVINLQNTLDGKLAATSFTYSALPGKPTMFPTDTANVSGLQATLDNKLTAYPGVATNFGAFQINTFGFDSAQGEGLGNIVIGGVMAKTANASATGYNFTQTGRGATRYGGHDSTINTYVANTISGVAGQAIGWIQTLSMSATAANFLVQPQFNGANVATTADLTSGLAGKQNVLGFTPANVAGATFTGAVTFSSTVTIGGGTPWTSANFTPSTKLDVSAFTWAGLSGKPSTFAPSAHTHTTAEVTGLDVALAAKAPLASPAFTGTVTLPTVTMANGVWFSTADAKQRMFFSANSDSIWKSSNYHYWRKGDDTTIMTLTDGGQLQLPYSNVRASNTGGTGQFTAVSGSTMAGFYNDGSQFYILKHATSNTAFDGHRPFYVNLSTGQVTIDGTGASTTAIGGGLQVAQAFRSLQTVDATTQAATGMGVRIRARSDNVNAILQFTDTGATAQWTSLVSGGAGDLTCTTGYTVGGEFYGNSWIRSNTSGTGWYHQVHGVGIYANSSAVKVYGDANFSTGGTISGGNVTMTSDARFKRNIRPLEALTGLAPKRFSKDNREALGYIAQEVQAVAPEAVHELDHETGGKYLTLDPMAVLAAVHAQLAAENADLRTRIAALEAR